MNRSYWREKRPTLWSVDDRSLRLKSVPTVYIAGPSYWVLPQKDNVNKCSHRMKAAAGECHINMGQRNCSFFLPLVSMLYMISHLFLLFWNERCRVIMIRLHHSSHQLHNVCLLHVAYSYWFAKLQTLCICIKCKGPYLYNIATWNIFWIENVNV